MSAGRVPVRRRTKPSLRARVLRFWVPGIVLAAGLAAGFWTVARLPALRIHALTIAGNQRVARSEIAARAAIDPAQNVWLLDRAAAERRIEGIPYVLAARVGVLAPATVRITVEERRPDACVRDAEGRELLVDADLRVLEDICSPMPALTYDLRSTLEADPGTFLRNAELRALAADARALDTAGNRYRSFARDPFGELEATLANGIAVRFGSDADLARKEKLVGPILAELGPRADDVRIVDVRIPATPVVEYRK